MVIQELIIDNFKGISHLELNPSDLNAYVGVNGAGKSSITDAIIYVLSGNMPKDALRKGALEMSVEAVMNTKDTIRRSYSPEGQKVMLNGRNCSIKALEEYITNVTNVDSADIPTTDKKEKRNAWQQTPAGEVICEIDGLLEQGFQFDNISYERWKSVYREECVKILSSKYTITEEQSNKMTRILSTLKNNMFDQNERTHALQAEATIDVLSQFLKMDGVSDGF